MAYGTWRTVGNLRVIEVDQYHKKSPAASARRADGQIIPDVDRYHEGNDGVASERLFFLGHGRCFVTSLHRPSTA